MAQGILMAEAGTNHINVSSAEIEPGVHELKIEGSLDWTNFSKVDTVIRDLFRGGIYRIVINLKDTTYISSAGFGCFINSLDTATKNGGDLIFAATPPPIREVFGMLGLSKVLHFADTAAAAVEMLRK